MEITYSHVAGLDVDKKTVVACIFTPGPMVMPHQAFPTFDTMAHELLALGDYLVRLAVMQSPMKARGSSGRSRYTSCSKAALRLWSPTCS